MVKGLRIGEVARRTGLSTSRLRVWESRYALVTPARTSGRQRLYSEADVERVRFVRDLVAQGWSIAAAVTRLREDERQGRLTTSTTEDADVPP